MTDRRIRDTTVGWNRAERDRGPGGGDLAFIRTEESEETNDRKRESALQEV